MIEEDTYTFIGAATDGRAVFMDIASLHGDAAALRHGQRLMEQHASGAMVEVWRGAGLVAMIPRAVGLLP